MDRAKLLELADRCKDVRPYSIHIDDFESVQSAIETLRDIMSDALRAIASQEQGEV